MIENIRRIGIFMIVAQTVIHFASGKQYEKYMKIIAGVLILLQFINPFVSSPGDFIEKWQEEIAGMMSQMEEQNQAWQKLTPAAGSVETMVLQQIEEEVKLRMNNIVSDYGCAVADVEIDLEQTVGSSGTGEEDRSWNFRSVKITLRRNSGSNPSDTLDPDSSYTHDPDAHGDTTIRIEEITIGDGTKSDTAPQGSRGEERDADTQTYQRLFAQALGIAEDRVEVVYREEW